MPRPLHFGRPHLLFLLLLMMADCTFTPSTSDTPSTSAVFETTQESRETDGLDYSASTRSNDNILPDPSDEEGIGSSSTTDVFSTTTSDAPGYPSCPDDFQQLTLDWCFHFRYNIEERMSFQEAQYYCAHKELGSILPAITSVEVSTALMLERTTVLGISPLEYFYIGLGCDKDTHKWKWIDGPDFDASLTFFARQFTSTQYCSVHSQPYMFDQFGTWSRSPDMDDVNLVVCAVRPYGFSPAPPVDSPCTEPWTSLPGGMCYRLITMKTDSVYEAEQVCRNNSGHLPSIRSAEQNFIIEAYLAGKSLSNSRFWIGLYCEYEIKYDPGSPGKRVWSDGSPFTGEYTNFLDPADNTTECNVAFVNTFVYNGAQKGMWQKEHWNTTAGMNTLMCARPDPEPAPSTTTRRPTKPTKKLTNEDTTTVERITTTDVTSSDEPENTESTVDHTTSLQPTTTTDKPETSTTEKPRNLTRLELILIIALAIVLVAALVIILIYFLCKRCRREDVQEIFTNVQKRFSRSNTNAIVRTDEWEVRRQFVGIDYSRQLGRGAFGSVYLGRVLSGNIPEMAVKTLIQLNTLKKEDDFVAVKTLHETADRQAASEFLDEINIMKKIGFHERLVNLLACVTETEPLLLVVEYCSNGDLLQFMRERRQFMLKLKDTVGHDIAGRHSIITQKQQLMFGIQIAYGMEYLSSRGFVHRDLAARNILVDANETCKIGDFGLCRVISGESEQYISRGGRLPWKWMAPEALERFYFSVESDVWSFGVLLFEIITLGGNPYPDWPAVELLHRLKAGERMPKPEGCSNGYYDLMLACWRGIAMQRLSFERIRRKLAEELEESSSDDYYLKLDAAAKYYQEALESPRFEGRFNSF